MNISSSSASSWSWGRLLYPAGRETGQAMSRVPSSTRSYKHNQNNHRSLMNISSSSASSWSWRRLLYLQKRDGGRNVMCTILNKVIQTQWNNHRSLMNISSSSASSSSWRRLLYLGEERRGKGMSCVPSSTRSYKHNQNNHESLMNISSSSASSPPFRSRPWIARSPRKFAIKVECDVNYKTVLLDYSLLLSFILYELIMLIYAKILILFSL